MMFPIYLKFETRDEDWYSLYFAANIDFIAFLLLLWNNIVMGSGFWLAKHSVEKYLKSYLSKNVVDYSKGREGHDINILWENFKSHSNIKLAKNDYDTFIYELSSVTEACRYSSSSIILIFRTLNMYINLCNDIRKAILGSEYEKKARYGLEEAQLGSASEAIFELIEKYKVDYS